MIVDRRLPGVLGSISWAKIGLAVASALYVYVAAATLVSAINDVGSVSWTKVIGCAIVPIAVFCFVRYPVVFPLGLYIVLAPFDALLTVGGGASLVRFVGIAVMGALAMRMLRVRRVLVPHRSWYVWLGFTVYMTFTLLWTADFQSGTKTALSIASLFLVMTVLAVYPVTVREFKIILALIVLGGLAAALYCIKQFYSGSTDDESNARLNLGQGDLSLDVNYLAGAFVTPIAIATAGVFYARNSVVRIVCGLSIFPFMFAIFTNASREAVLAAVAIFIYFIARSKQRLVAIGMGVAAVGSMAFFPNILNRLFTADAADGSGRTEIWRAGMHSFPDHWLLGAGVGSYMEIYDRNLLQVFTQSFQGWHRPGHSIVFVSLNDFGVFGSLIVLAAWVVTFRQLRAIPKTGDAYGFRLACEAMILGLGVQMLFLDPFYIKYVWFAHSLALMCMNVVFPRAFGLRSASVPAAPMRPLRAARGA